MNAAVRLDESPWKFTLSLLNKKITNSVQLHPNIMASIIINHSSTKLSQHKAKFAAYEKIIVIETKSFSVKLSEYFNIYKLKLLRKPRLK
tara:strand:- start:202 stop:471 length:270 start_codon:yes stop_codon:yes gene_type:complete